MIRKSDWKAIQQELLDAERRPVGEPPAAEELLAYTRGELSPLDEERVRRALICYPELANALTKPFPDDDAKPGEPGYVSDEEVNNRLADLRRSISESESGNVLRFWRRAALAIAAALLLAIGGLLAQGVWNARRLAAELAKPRVAAQEVLLLADGQRGGPTAWPPLPDEGDSVLLVAPIINQPSFPTYRLEILDRTGDEPRTLWSSTALRRRSNDTFAILVPRAFLKPGKHQVVLYGIDGTREEQLATYSLTVPEP